MNTKRKLKGMTLMEVVVSLAVYAIIGLLLAEIMTLVNATMKATNQLSRRLTYEAKFADNLLTSDGSSSFASEVRTITLTDGTINGSPSSNNFTISANGSMYTTNADNMQYTNVDKDPTKMLISANTNYRFLVFGKTYRATPAVNDVFNLKLNLASDPAVTSNLNDNPITKIIVDASGCPHFGGCFEYGTDDEDTTYPRQVLQSSTYPQIDDDCKLVVNTNFNILSNGGELLHLAIPAADADGNALVNPNGSLKGKIKVLIFRSIEDQIGNKYNWYDPSNKILDALTVQFKGNRDKADKNGFPASVVLDLDFVMSAPNPNTGELSFFNSVEYIWNPNKSPDEDGYLVVGQATSSN